MAQSEEDVVRQKNNTMADDVVCISDDDDGPSPSANANDRQTYGGHYNAYENLQIYNPTKRAEEEESNDDREDVVYVPDDNEEEKFLIGPIRKKASAIIFGSRLNAPTEFPYEALADIDSHVEKSLKNVPGTTEKNIWECILEQLSIMRIAYSKHIDVCTKLNWRKHSIASGVPKSHILSTYASHNCQVLLLHLAIVCVSACAPVDISMDSVA